LVVFQLIVVMTRTTAFCELPNLLFPAQEYDVNSATFCECAVGEYDPLKANITVGANSKSSARKTASGRVIRDMDITSLHSTANGSRSGEARDLLV
jgi:hypothetical protein